MRDRPDFEELGQLELDSSQDALDRLSNVPQKRYNPVTRSRCTVAEAYVDGRIALHLHLGFQSPDPSNFCAVFHKAQIDQGLPFNGDSYATGKTVSPASNRIGCEIEHFVLVVVGQCPEQPKIVGTDRVVPSLVWLQPLYHCDMRGINSDEMPPPGAGKRMGIGADRELELGIRRGTMKRTEIPDSMVENAPKVVQAIADEETQEVRWLSVSLEPEDLISRIRINLNDDAIGLRFKESEKLLLDTFQVLVGVLQL